MIPTVEIDSRAVGDPIFQAEPPIEDATGLLALGTEKLFFLF